LNGPQICGEILLWIPRKEEAARLLAEFK